MTTNEAVLRDALEEIETMCKGTAPAVVARHALAATATVASAEQPAGEVLWSYEGLQPGTEGKVWCEFYSRDKPSNDSWVRNIRCWLAAPISEDTAPTRESLSVALERAERALLRAGFKDLGGQEWKPPLGQPPRFIYGMDPASRSSALELSRNIMLYLGDVVSGTEPGEDPRLDHVTAMIAEALPSGALTDPLPRWIDDQKGSDPNIDDLIDYIEQIRAAQCIEARNQQGDAERLRFVMQDIEGFVGVKLDKCDFAMRIASERGNDEPTNADDLDGIRMLIDEATSATRSDN